MIRSTAVFDGVRDVPYPAAILVEGDRIRRMLPWDYVHAGTPLSECFPDKIADTSPKSHLSDESPDAELANLPLYDYGARLILPSFLDAHTHLFSAAAVASDFVCDTLGEGKSREECVSILKNFADSHPDLKRIRGTGWYTNNWSDKTLPDKRILDEAFPDRPVYLQCADCHSFWLNTRALEEARIDSLPEPEGGQFCRWKNGELTGLLLEPEACAPATEKLMEFSDEEMREILTDYQRVLAENGVAAVSEMFAEDYSEETRHKYQILKQLDEEGKLVCNTYIYTELFGHTDFADYFDMKEAVDSAHVAINGVKGFVDGVTDTPVVTVNPFYTIYAAVTRKNDEGVQFSQNPWETVDMATALKCYTSGASCAYGKEGEMGSLEAGKKANLIVLDRNLFEIPEEEIERAEVAANYFEGQLVYIKRE